MGFPMIQVFMIAARQVSKPVADAVLKYGKDHPGFRNKILIPVGRGLVRLSTRLRMKRLGLGESTSTVQVSESAALEQASDFVQQLVLFMYSLGVFSGYYFYTVVTSEETVKMDAFKAYREDSIKVIEDLEDRVKKLESLLAAAGPLQIPSSRSSVTVPSSSPNATSSTTKSADEKPKFRRVSSLPIDAAAEVVLKGVGEFIVVRSGDSVGIEEAARFRARNEPLVFRKKELLLSPPPQGIVGWAERCVLAILGRFSG